MWIVSIRDRTFALTTDAITGVKVKGVALDQKIIASEDHVETSVSEANQGTIDSPDHLKGIAYTPAILAGLRHPEGKSYWQYVAEGNGRLEGTKIEIGNETLTVSPDHQGQVSVYDLKVGNDEQTTSITRWQEHGKVSIPAEVVTLFRYGSATKTLTATIEVLPETPSESDFVPNWKEGAWVRDNINQTIGRIKGGRYVVDKGATDHFHRKQGLPGLIFIISSAALLTVSAVFYVVRRRKVTSEG
ncbi:MAG: hypothetical protein JSS72_12060 [Armatimonadetes bacterium]|nr:hypothetical protein [Armatimonadota bacterium]